LLFAFRQKKPKSHSQNYRCGGHQSEDYSNLNGKRDREGDKEDRLADMHHKIGRGKLENNEKGGKKNVNANCRGECGNFPAL
jgi:hypothetical protein